MWLPEVGRAVGTQQARLKPLLTLMFSREDVIRTFLTVSPTSHYTEPWEWPKVTTALPSAGRCWNEHFPGSYSRCPHSRWDGSRRGSRSSCYLCGVELTWPRLCSKTEGPLDKARRYRSGLHFSGAPSPCLQNRGPS